MESEGSMAQPPKMRELCQKAQNLEKKNQRLRSEIDTINQKEKVSSPSIRNIYEIITRCFVILFDIQRFSNLLVLSQVDNKNDFVRCSIVIKNFAAYFKSVSAKLEKNGRETLKLKKSKQEKILELKTETAEYEKLLEQIEDNAEECAKMREENIIQNDVVCHLATKSESLEELDAELEAENAVGVLKNTQIATELTLAYPVVGKAITEFGDKGENNEMIYCISFETNANAVVTSPAKGVVVFSGQFLNYGNILIISNGEYRVFLYGVDVLFSSTGDMVEIGDYIGKMKGEDGHVVKMELKKSGEPLNPRHWIQKTMEGK
ncbi:MAG: peptidoglycan DD-metalloendopeptidase family protein [Holosporaceae bacterium]|nr:peptidoglycan DD-metalloendopeptidase family protein [Holosporaceae bacterium]